MLKYQKEIDRLERAYNAALQHAVEHAEQGEVRADASASSRPIASRVKHVYDVANRDVESWLRAVMSPLETQVREHHLQLRRRLESVKRIHRRERRARGAHRASSSSSTRRSPRRSPR